MELNGVVVFEEADFETTNAVMPLFDCCEVDTGPDDGGLSLSAIDKKRDGSSGISR